MPIKWVLLIMLLAVVCVPAVSAQQNDIYEKDTPSEEHVEGEFDAGKFVIEHVLDAYDWHIASLGDKHFSIPLPIILYSTNPELHEGKRFHVFMSSKFHHGHDDYRGFRISHTEDHNNKIVEVDTQGNEIGRPVDISITKAVAGGITGAVVLILLALAGVRSARKTRE